jgi:peptidoglycan/xylan/chitin deacetylase (PgdA/CDA1 family)
MKKTALLILALLIFVLLSSGAIAFTQPSWALMFLERRSPNVLYSIETREPVVALTIDDGPHSITTPAILDELRANDAKATFFLISENIDGNESLVQQIIDEGHEIGNHLTSERPSILYSQAEFESQLIEAHEALSQYSPIRWFRPGSGWYNNAMLSTLAKHDYQCVLGSVYPFDAEVPSSQFATRYILWRVKPGAIIVLHDKDGRGQRTAETLRTILPELKEQGFRITTLSELADYADTGF